MLQIDKWSERRSHRTAWFVFTVLFYGQFMQMIEILWILFFFLTPLWPLHLMLIALHVIDDVEMSTETVKLVAWSNGNLCFK